MPKIPDFWSFGLNFSTRWKNKNPFAGKGRGKAANGPIVKYDVGEGVFVFGENFLPYLSFLPSSFLLNLSFAQSLALL